MTASQPAGATSDGVDSWSRIAGYAGIAFAVLFVVMGVSIASGAPAFTDGADEIREWFGDNQGPIALFTWLSPFLVGPLQLTFAAGLRKHLDTVDNSGGILPRVSFAGAVANFAFGVVGLAFWGVLTLDPVLESASDGLLVTLSALDAVVFFVIGAWTSALFTVAASLVMVRTRVMPVWLGALGCVAGAVQVISGLWIFDGDPTSALGALGLLGGLLGLIWIVITSVFLIRSTKA